MAMDRRALSDVLQDILRNLQELVRSEIRLAKAEVRADARDTAVSATWLIAGVGCALSAWTLALWAAVYGLASVVPLWASALLIALVVAAAAATLIAVGRRRIATIRPLPERTVASVKEDLALLKQSSK
jgi:hypothetical protein